MNQRPSAVGRTSVIVFIAAIVGACGSTGSTSPGTDLASGGPASPTPGSASPAPTSGPSVGTGGPVVDLTFTGSQIFTAKGSAGRCILVTRTDGTLHFGFEATEADYPGLGQSFSLANLDGTYVDIKWVINDALAYGDDPTAPVALSSDHKSVTLNGALGEFVPIGVAPSHPESVTGTISCP